MHEVTEWLKGLGLVELTETFTRNQIDARSLLELDGDDLREMGIPLGPRKLLLKAIDELRAASGGTARSDAKVIAGAPAERRQLTIAFCDLVGSTQLSAQMDPEDYREMLGQYRSLAAAVIRKYDGHIASFMGDGILVYFGYPRAHEDDAERAIRTALEIVEAISEGHVGDESSVEVRIGIATGLVVAGDMVVQGAHEENAVLGDTPNLAARLQSIAQPNAVVLSEGTYRLVEGRFVFDALGPQSLKGFDDPVPAYRAVSVGHESRFEIAAARGLTALAGRESELMLLRKRWEQVQHNEGQVVLLSGEPGIGKSRISEELCAGLGGTASAVLRFQCSPFHGGSAFYPFISHLRRAASIVQGDSASEVLNKLKPLLAPLRADLPVATSLLMALFSLPLDGCPSLEMTPQKQRLETIRVLLKLVELQAMRGPVLILVEDSHWIDPTSQSVLDTLISEIHSKQILCLITCRPEFVPTWGELGHVTTLSLNRLGRRDVGNIIDAVSGGSGLDAGFVARILERADGVPLFVEELTKSVIEAQTAGAADGDRRAGRTDQAALIPATLHDSLLARLDRLGSVKEVAQTAACFGREFSLDLLAAVMPLSTVDIEAALQQLADAELVFRRDGNEAETFQFKHALVQDAAYESLLVRRRRELHACIAETFVEQFPDLAAFEPERVAQHYSAAGMASEAVPYWLAAGRKALAGSSLPEAIDHLTKALDLTSLIEEVTERAELELDVRTVLGAANMALRGWPAPEIYDVVRPACDLFEQGYGRAGSFMNLWHLWLHHGCRAEHRKGLHVVDRMLDHAECSNDPVLSLVASFTAALAHFWVGNYDKAERHEQVVLDLYDFERDRDLARDYNHDPKCTLLSWSALRVWARGYPDRARQLSDDAVELARAVGHPFNLCWTLGNSSLAYGQSGDYDTASARVAELLRIAKEQELGFMEAYMAPAVLCHSACLAGDYEIAIAEGARSEAVWRSIGGRFFSPTVKASMAKACLGLGRLDEASSLITDAVSDMESTGEFIVAEEVYRIAGLVTLERSGDGGAAETLLMKAFDYSKAHGTLSFELRIAMARAGLWRRNSRSDEARECLATALKAIAEGHDTADQRAARDLLAQLS